MFCPLFLHFTNTWYDFTIHNFLSVYPMQCTVILPTSFKNGSVTLTLQLLDRTVSDQQETAPSPHNWTYLHFFRFKHAQTKNRPTVCINTSRGTSSTWAAQDSILHSGRQYERVRCKIIEARACLGNKLTVTVQTHRVRGVWSRTAAVQHGKPSQWRRINLKKSKMRYYVKYSCYSKKTCTAAAASLQTPPSNILAKQCELATVKHNEATAQTFKKDTAYRKTTAGAKHVD